MSETTWRRQALQKFRSTQVIPFLGGLPLKRTGMVPNKRLR
jgi:hypothetical protein